MNLKPFTKRPLVVAILAAGKGKRMKSDLPKVMHSVGGKPMLLHVIALSKKLNAQRYIAIIGHGKEQVIEAINKTGTEYVIQEPQLGTAHAVQQTEPLLTNFKGDLLVLSGDVPLLQLTTIEQLLNTHYSYEARATLLTAIFNDPTGYGRILRKTDGTLDRIVEDKDCNKDQRMIKEINAGVYMFDSQILFKTIKLIDNKNQQCEYYLPDVLQFFLKYGHKVALQTIADHNEIAGVNTKEQLLKINRIFKTHYD